MEASSGGGRETSTGSSSANKAKGDYHNTNREIDQEHLANLLRESANLVERGEFGSVLYEALQDFRAYYKQKYPKTGKKKKSSGKKSDKSSRSKISSTTDKADSASSAILEDLKESEENAEKIATSHEDSKSEIGDPTLLESERSMGISGDVSSSSFGVTQKANAGSNDDAPEQTEASSAKINDTSTQSNDEEASKVNDSKTSIPVSVPVNKADISSGPSTPPRGGTAPTNPVEPTSEEPTASAQTPGGKPDYYNTATPNTNNRSPFLSSSTPTRGAVFGKKFKFGATLQNVKKGAMNVKKAAKNVTEKISENIDKHHNHHNRTSTTAKEELEFFAETGVEKAQSSGRRTWANVDDYNNSQEFAGSSDYKSRVTPGVAGASDAGSRASEHEPTNSVKSDDPNYQFAYEKNHGRPASDRNLGQPQQNPRYNSNPVEASDNGDSYDSGGDRIRANSSASIDLPDPIMEGGIRPKFQRPANTNSPLIVSGWIEQFRRSKMRLVWKEVFVSLVEGRKPGEVTTLWIQREIIQPSTGLTELEALQRIPLKILEDVSFTENTTDNQFRLKVYHGTEDFVFRCDDSPNDALRWVQILKKHKQLADKLATNSENTASQDSSIPHKQAQQPQAQQPPSTKGMAIRDLRAICHGAGIVTTGMERWRLEATAEEVQRRGTYGDQKGETNAAPPAHTQQYTPQQQQQQQQQYPNANQVNTDPSQSRPKPPADTESASQQQEQQQEQPKRIGIKELRAICHGGGINTAGMERRELEAAAKEVQSRGTYFDPPIASQAPNEDEARARHEKLRRQKQEQENEELRRRQQDAQERHMREVEEAQRRAAAVEQEQRRRAAEEEARRRATEEEQRRRAVEEEARRRAAAEEQHRRQREAQVARARYAQQQAAWQQQQQVEEQRRRAAEQQAAAERRRRDEARQKEQQWSNTATGAHHHQQQQQPHHYHHQQQQQQHRHQAYSQQQWQQQQQQQRPPPQQHYQQQQQQQRNHTPTPPQPHHHQQPQNQNQPPPPPQQAHQQRQHSGTDNKYAKMANQSDDGQAAITKIKHSILIQWALQPPQLQMLRPIAALVTTIHNVFPPALGVSAHDYFKKWKPITREDVAGVNGLPEEAKLKKSVRKIRFFLHPDKLPNDLDEEQKFTVKMLWDITNDAWEEYQKHKEDLDWVN